MGPVYLLLVLIFISSFNGQRINSRTTNRFPSSRQFSGGLDDDVLPADDFNVRRPISNSLVTGDDDRVFGGISNNAVRVRAPLFQPFLLQGLTPDQRRNLQRRPHLSLLPFFSNNLFRPQQAPVNNFLPSRGTSRRQRPTTRIPEIDIFATVRPRSRPRPRPRPQPRQTQQFRQQPSEFYSSGPRDINDIRSAFNYRPNDDFGVSFDFFKNTEPVEQTPRTAARPQQVRTARPRPNSQPVRNVRPRPQPATNARPRPRPQPATNVRPRPRPQPATNVRPRPRPQPARPLSPKRRPLLPKRPRPVSRLISGIRQPQPQPNFHRLSNQRGNRLPARRPVLNVQSNVNAQPETFPVNDFTDDSPNFREDVYEEVNEAPEPPKRARKPFVLPSNPNRPFHNDDLIFGDFLKLSAIKKTTEKPTPKPRRSRARRIEEPSVEKERIAPIPAIQRPRPGPRRNTLTRKPIRAVKPTETPTAPAKGVRVVTVKRPVVTVPPTPQATKAPASRSRARSRQSRRRSRQRSRRQRSRQRQRQTVAQRSTERHIEIPEPDTPSTNSLIKEKPQRASPRAIQSVASVPSQPPVENSRPVIRSRDQFTLPQQRPPRLRPALRPTVPARAERRTPTPQKREKKTTFQNPTYTRAKKAGEIPHDTNGDGSPGTAGLEYPVYSTIPETSFSCLDQRSLGYYSDPEAHCQLFHFCQAGGVKSSFLCPNGTLYNQEKLACEWWHNVNCALSTNHYHVNDRLYKDPYDEIDDFY